ncbi:MAG TPA: hypothetical protein VEH06_02130 [Candidatus Bathyarchaeia archaeon]|nr:hypothetical protein [Candidatus Bathyarchaeia archaeon]
MTRGTPIAGLEILPAFGTLSVELKPVESSCCMERFYGNAEMRLSDTCIFHIDNNRLEAVNMVKISIISYSKSQANPNGRPAMLHLSFNERLTESSKQIIDRPDLGFPGLVVRL